MSVYIIAEIGNTHEGSLGLAKEMVRAAASAGADAVKLQTHLFDAESVASAPSPPYFGAESRRDYFERTAFSKDQWLELKRFCEAELLVDFFSSPFSEEAVDLLASIGVNTWKIPSGEVTNLPLLEKIGLRRERVLLSSGMSTWSELADAVTVLQSAGVEDLTVLQCTSEYPCHPRDSGLNVLNEIKERFPGVKIGYSDHTVGPTVAIAAAVLGAEVIEKHFTLSKKMYGSDAFNAAEPEEFELLVNQIREVEESLNNSVNKDQKAAALSKMKDVFQKSIVAKRPLPQGHVIERGDMAFKKPGTGISAAEYESLIGKTLRRDLDSDEFLTYQDLS